MQFQKPTSSHGNCMHTVFHKLISDLININFKSRYFVTLYFSMPLKSPLNLVAFKVKAEPREEASHDIDNPDAGVAGSVEEEEGGARLDQEMMTRFCCSCEELPL